MQEARKALRIFEGGKAQQKVVIPVKNTLRTFSAYWLEYEEADKRETTKHGYRNMLDNHILPYFGDKELQKIGKQDIHMYFSTLREKGLSSNTVRKHYDLLKSIFLSAEQGEKKVAKSPRAGCPRS